MVHLILTIWTLGASPDTIQLKYEQEAKYQRPALPKDENIIKSFRDKKVLMNHLYDGVHYPNFLAFFQREIETRGVGDVINEYLFSGDELAESLLSRLFAVLMHPVIHLGFGIEFEQPAIVAQALAQTAVHEDYLGSMFLRPAEKAALETSAVEKKTLVEIMDQMRVDKRLNTASPFAKGVRFAEGILQRAPEMAAHCCQWTVPEDKIQERVVEMINTAGMSLPNFDSDQEKELRLIGQ